MLQMNQKGKFQALTRNNVWLIFLNAGNSLVIHTLNKGVFSMIELSDAAKTQIDNYFQGKEPTPIRIFLNSGG